MTFSANLNLKSKHITPSVANSININVHESESSSSRIPRKRSLSFTDSNESTLTDSSTDKITSEHCSEE